MGTDTKTMNFEKNICVIFLHSIHTFERGQVIISNCINSNLLVNCVTIKRFFIVVKMNSVEISARRVEGESCDLINCSEYVSVFI